MICGATGMWLSPPGTSFYTGDTGPSQSCVSFRSTLKTKEGEGLVAWEQSKCSGIRDFTRTGSRRPAPVGHLLWLDADPIVDGSADPLLTAEITFGCLHGHMSQQELNLVEFSACGVTQLGA